MFFNSFIMLHFTDINFEEKAKNNQTNPKRQETVCSLNQSVLRNLFVQTAFLFVSEDGEKICQNCPKQHGTKGVVLYKMLSNEGVHVFNLSLETSHLVSLLQPLKWIICLKRLLPLTFEY